MPDIAHFHPQIVHFAIVLLLAGVVMRWISLTGKVPFAAAGSEGKSGKCGSCHTPLPALYTSPVALSDRSFDSFVASYPGPVLAEFWAPW